MSEPVYRPFLPRREPRAGLTKALAVFRLGHLGVSMWVWPEVLWEDLVARSSDQIWHPGAELGIPNTVALLLETRMALLGSIVPEILPELRPAIERFVDFQDEWIERLGRVDKSQGV